MPIESNMNLDRIKQQQAQFNAKYGNVSNEVLDWDSAYQRVVEKATDDLQKFYRERDEASDNTKTKKKMWEWRAQIEEALDKAAYAPGETYDVSGYEEKDEFIRDATEELLGWSILADARDDDDVDDIFCITWDKIYVEKNGKNELYHRTFRSPQHYKRIVERILQLEGKSVDEGANKIVDSVFFEDRIAITDPSVTPKGYTITIRKHRESHLDLDDIIKGGTMTSELADVLGMMVKGELNMIYAGITGSGKTTSLRALLDKYVTQMNKRMLVIEDTQELYPQNPHTVELKTVKGDDRYKVEMHDLIKTALRLKPKHIVVGEVRGAEAEAMVEAMETGHSTVTTMHGKEAINIVNRLVTKYLMQMPELSIEVVERIIGSAVDYIAIQDDIPGIGRRVTTVKEVSYDYENGTVRLVPIFEFDFETQKFVMINKLSPDKATFMMRRGINREEAQQYMRPDKDVFITSLEEYKEQSTQEFEKIDNNTDEINKQAKPVSSFDYDEEEEL